jgi:hypothetical protein
MLNKHSQRAVRDYREAIRDGGTDTRSTIQLRWLSIVEGLIRAAESGNVKAFELAREEAWGAPSVPQKMSIEEFIHPDDKEQEAVPVWYVATQTPPEAIRNRESELMRCPNCGETLCQHWQCARCDGSDCCAAKGAPSQNEVSG